MRRKYKGDKQQKYIQRIVGSDAVNSDLSSTDYTSCVVVPAKEESSGNYPFINLGTELIK
jgi:hypothetical protein